MNTIKAYLTLFIFCAFIPQIFIILFVLGITILFSFINWDWGFFSQLPSVYKLLVVLFSPMMMRISIVVGIIGVLIIKFTEEYWGTNMVHTINDIEFAFYIGVWIGSMVGLVISIIFNYIYETITKKVNENYKFYFSKQKLDWECTNCLHDNSCLKTHCVFCGYKR